MANPSKRLPTCRACGSDKIARLRRVGFLQERVLPLLSIFPWRCRQCGASQLARARGRAHKTRQTQSNSADKAA